MRESVLTNAKVCGRLVVRRFGFDYREAFVSLVEVQRVRFDKRKGCRRIVDFRRVHFDNRKNVYEACRVWESPLCLP